MVLCFCNNCPDEPAAERLEPGNSMMESFGRYHYDGDACKYTCIYV